MQYTQLCTPGYVVQYTPVEGIIYEKANRRRSTLSFNLQERKSLLFTLKRSKVFFILCLVVLVAPLEAIFPGTVANKTELYS